METIQETAETKTEALLALERNRLLSQRNTDRSNVGVARTTLMPSPQT